MLEPKNDPATGLPYVEQGGERRILACLKPTEPSGFPKFGAARQLKRVPRTEWKDFSYKRHVGPIKDQDGHGACVGFGGSGGAECARSIAGQTFFQLSGNNLYSQINGNRDQGALVSDALKALMSVGVCLESEFPETGSIWKRDVPSNAWETARRFRLAEGHECESFDDIVSAILCGRIVVFGVDIGTRFQPDSQGVLPAKRGSGGGHCMYACGVKTINGKWMLEVINSWGARWGVDGCCWMPESYFSGYMDAFAIVGGINDPLDPHEPPSPIA
jgi:hypothetical protein